MRTGADPSAAALLARLAEERGNAGADAEEAAEPAGRTARRVLSHSEQFWRNAHRLAKQVRIDSVGVPERVRTPPGKKSTSPRFGDIRGCTSEGSSSVTREPKALSGKGENVSIDVVLNVRGN